MPTPQKAQILQQTTGRLEGCGHLPGRPVGHDGGAGDAAAPRCREQKIQVSVIKNTLLKRAFNERASPSWIPTWSGHEPRVQPGQRDGSGQGARGLRQGVREAKVKAAVVDGRLFDDKAIATLATLPSREVLLRRCSRR